MEPLGRWTRAVASGAAVLLLLPLAGSAAGSDGHGASLAEEIPAILESAVLPRDTAAAARRLAALGPPAVPLLVDALAARPPADGEPEAPGAGQSAAILAGLGLLQRGAVLGELERRAAAPLPERRAALAILLELGRADDLELALKAAFPAPGSPAGESLDAELAAAVAAILTRDPEAAWRIPGLAGKAPLPAGAALVRGLGASGRREGLDVLASLLYIVPELERGLVTEIGRLAALLAPPFGEAARVAIRSRLGSADPQVVREAALAAGRLLDDAALPQLIELLDDPRGAIAATALFALRSITGLSLPAERARWEAWLAAEQTWFETELDPTLARLQSPSRLEVRAGLRSISLRRLRRLELAGEVQPLLLDVDAEVRATACRSLGALGACTRVELLIQCLEDHDAVVAAEAWRALQVLTGAHLAADPEGWRLAWADAGTVVRR